MIIGISILKIKKYIYSILPDTVHIIRKNTIESTKDSDKDFRINEYLSERPCLVPGPAK